MLTRYIELIRRWLWLLILAALAAGITTYWVGKQTPPVYEANARLIVGPGIDSSNPDLNDLRTGGQLMRTYAELATTRPVLQAVIDELDLSISPEILDNFVKATAQQETQILSIDVQDEDPGRAVAVANTVANVLVRMSPSNPNNPQAKIKEKMHDEAGMIETEIGTTEATIRQLEAEFQATTGDVAKQRLILDQISQERTRLADAHRTLALLYDSLQAASTNQVKIVEPATRAPQVARQLQLRVLIGGMAGLVLGLVIVLTFEYFDHTIKTADELVHTAGLPLLGVISKHKALHGAGHGRLVVQALPQSRTAEDYRILGFKLLSKYEAKSAYHRILAENQAKLAIEQQLPATGDYPLRSVLVSSSQVSDESSEIAANLAVVLAQTGRRVILVDANLRRPNIDQLFGIVGRGGLTDVLTEQSKSPELIPVNWASGLSVLPSGPVPPNAFGLLASTRMADLIEELESQAEIVVISASPILSFADSSILASHIDGVIMVARSGKTHRNMVRDAVRSLHSFDVQTIGTILDFNQGGRFPRLSWWKAKTKRVPDNKPGNESARASQADNIESEQSTVISLTSAES